MREDLSDRNYLSAHEDRELVLNQAARWLQEHRNDDIGPALLVRDLFDLASQAPPAQPAAIGLSRSQFAERQRRYYEELPNSSPGYVRADLAAADALLAAAGLAWRAEEAEAGEGGSVGTHPEMIVCDDPFNEKADLWPEATFDSEADWRAAKGRYCATEEAWDRVKASAGPGDTVAAWQGPWTDRRRHEACEAELAEARRQEADAALGARMRELLADTALAPTELVTLLQFAEIKSPNHLAGLAWAWLRQQAGLADGQEAGQADRLPERIDWVPGPAGDRPALLAAPGSDFKAVYAEAVRRYNLHGKIEARLKGAKREAHSRDSLILEINQLAALLVEGRPNG